MPVDFADALEHWRKGDTTSATLGAQRLIATDPSLPQPFMLLSAIIAPSNPRRAIDGFRRALAIDTQDGNIWSNFGSLRQDLGDEQGALVAFMTAYALGVRTPHMMISIARHLVAKRAAITIVDGTRKTAIHFLCELFSANPELASEHQIELAKAIAVSPYTRGDGLTAEHLAQALRSRSAPQSALAIYAQDFLRDSQAGAALSELRTTAVPTSTALDDILRRLAKNEALLALLQEAHIVDWDFEIDLTILRRTLLSTIRNPADASDPESLRAIVALAVQCFINGWIFAEDPEEKKSIAEIVGEIESALRSGIKPRGAAVAILACYRRLLHVLPNLKVDDLPDRAEFARLVRLHISEPLEEARLEKTIRSLTPITDTTSAIVRRQYEENPYPTWMSTTAHGSQLSARQFISYNLPGILIESLPIADDCRVLMAGCGTGLYPIEFSLHVRTSRLLAIDLSRRSLAFAMRKAQELGIGSIEFAQADLFELADFDERFDIVSCVGVLHHTRSIKQGLTILRRLLRPRGAIQIGLYSTTARRKIKEARNIIAATGIPLSDDAIRTFRHTLLAEHPRLHQELLWINDFHALNECRDLLFHRHETTTDLPEVAAILDDLGLDFIGLNVDEDAIARYRACFPDDPRMTSLPNWHRFEAEYPDTFSNMYQFWALSRT